MSHGITEADLERMREFASTPKYERSPHILEPDDDDEE
mgnify:CR=1 FL=1